MMCTFSLFILASYSPPPLTTTYRIPHHQQWPPSPPDKITPAQITNLLHNYDDMVRQALHKGSVPEMMEASAGLMVSQLNTSPTFPDEEWQRHFYQACMALIGPCKATFQEKVFLHTFLNRYHENGSKIDPTFLKEMLERLE